MFCEAGNSETGEVGHNQTLKLKGGYMRSSGRQRTCSALSHRTLFARVVQEPQPLTPIRKSIGSP